jgi:hypothetical protein
MRVTQLSHLFFCWLYFIYRIKLKVTAIPHTKVYTKNHPDQQKHLFCPLQNQHPKGTNYQTTRLAVLLEQDGRLLWDELVLSKAIIFCSKKPIVEFLLFFCNLFLSESADNVAYTIIKDSVGRVTERIPRLEEKQKTKSEQSGKT